MPTPTPSPPPADVSAATDAADLDLRVKGSLPVPASTSAATPTPLKPPPLPPSNPLDSAPSSPSQIYLNLLILEASLRSQYLNHLARRRKFTFFLAVLFVWTAFFCVRIFVLGGSPYLYVQLAENVGLGGALVTAVLYYATGLYHKTIVEPRRFVSLVNRGLRGFNVKLVKVPLSTREWVAWWWGWYTFRPPPSRRPASGSKRRLSSSSSSSTRRPAVPSHVAPTTLSSMALSRSLSPRHEEDDEEEVEEYLPGGLHLKLVILPKGFSPDFREGWEIYRTEYWGKENEARQALREELKRNPPPPPRAEDHAHHHHLAVPEKKMRRGSRSGSVSSHRGRTPTPEPDVPVPAGRARRGSTASASAKRKPLAAASSLKGVPPGDISDSGSTTSALGERDRARRSESVRSSSSAGSSTTTTTAGEGKKKGSTRGGKGKKSARKTSSVGSGGSDRGETGA